FAAIAAAPVIAVATIDGARKLDRGVPHAISAGIYLGLGEGFWIAGYQTARASRVGSGRWRPESVAAALWGGATLGGILGGALAARGTYLSAASHVDLRATEGLAAGGALLGLTAGWLLTRNMPREVPDAAPPNVVVSPSFAPVAGGATIGATGVF